MANLHDGLPFQTLENCSFLVYEDYKNAFHEGVLAQKIAEVYKQDIDVVKKLASDPDHGGDITLSSLLEAMVGFELERDGILGISVSRGRSMTDLKDGWERSWDVKTPPSLKNIKFRVDVAAQSVLKKLKHFPDHSVGILLSVSFLKETDYFSLQEYLMKTLNVTQKFLIRQVSIEGVL